MENENNPQQLAQQSEQQLGMRQNLNIPNFNPPTDPDEAAQEWEKWLKTFARKLRFFRVTTLQDRNDALCIYGGEEI